MWRPSIEDIPKCKSHKDFVPCTYKSSLNRLRSLVGSVHGPADASARAGKAGLQESSWCDALQVQLRLAGAAALALRTQALELQPGQANALMDDSGTFLPSLSKTAKVKQDGRYF